MQDDEQQQEPEHEEAYPGHGPHADRAEPEDHSDPVELEVEDKFPVTPGTETSQERAKIAEDRVDELDEARSGGDDIEKPTEDDDEPDLSDESDDPDPVKPADDSPVADENPVQPGATDPSL